MPKMAFPVWLLRLDDCLIELYGLSYFDMPDCDYRGWYDRGTSPKTAAKRAMKAAGY